MGTKAVSYRTGNDYFYSVEMMLFGETETMRKFNVHSTGIYLFERRLNLAT